MISVSMGNRATAPAPAGRPRRGASSTRRPPPRPTGRFDARGTDPPRIGCSRPPGGPGRTPRRSPAVYRTRWPAATSTPSLSYQRPRAPVSPPAGSNPKPSYNTVSATKRRRWQKLAGPPLDQVAERLGVDTGWYGRAAGQQRKAGQFGVGRGVTGKGEQRHPVVEARPRRSVVERFFPPLAAPAAGGRWTASARRVDQELPCSFQLCAALDRPEVPRATPPPRCAGRGSRCRHS